MKATVKYFGMIAEQLEKAHELITFEESMPINLRLYFEQRDPILKEINYKIAVNQNMTDVLNHTSEPVEIALLPPFAGG